MKAFNIGEWIHLFFFFFTIFTMGNNFCDFLTASLDVLVLLLRDRIWSSRREFFQEFIQWRKKAVINGKLLPLQAYPFTIRHTQETESGDISFMETKSERKHSNYDN